MLAFLRLRAGAAGLAVTLATDCKCAVEVPQFRVRATANRTLARIARAECEARARTRQVHLVLIRGHSGDPGNKLADERAG